MIECISVNKQYKGKRQTVDAVKDVSLKIEKGEFVLLKGRSGAGKSTLLNLIGGLITPTSGEVKVDGHMINELDNKSLSNLLLNRIGIIFQSFNLLPTYDVYENIEVALAPKGLTSKEIQNMALPYFERFGLSDKMNLLPEELSAGQQQKVAIIELDRRDTPLDTATLAQWEELMGSNLKAPFFLAQAAAPLLTEAAGCIVNLVDVHAQRPLHGHPIYSMAKAANAMMVMALARELGPTVRVNGGAPGAILWPDRGLSDADKQTILHRTALGRTGTVEDIAQAVLFLVRDADYITGQVLAVDGGRTVQQ
jgi:ABC-type histidine transport system ATPase subunit